MSLLHSEEKIKKVTKWIVGIASFCILFYLGVRNIDTVADGFIWILHLFSPLIMGCIFAFVLNVPMVSIEKHLFNNNIDKRRKKMRRPLAIVFSLLLIMTIFIGVALLVIPEFLGAVKLVIQNILQAIDGTGKLISGGELEQTHLEGILESLNIDWKQLENNVRDWVGGIGESVAVVAVNTVGTIVNNIIDFFIGLIFSIYILLQKEKLKRQIRRLIHAWMPENAERRLLHVAGVCSKTFRNFIAGQLTEAFILGSLCTVGMLILRLPYAPMIGALVGVTALIPIVGAFVGTIVGAFMIMSVNPFQALIFVIFLLALQQLEGNLIYPKVVGSKINMPAIWVFAAVTIGGNLAGPIGMLIGVPVASVVYTLLKEVTEKREKQKRGNSILIEE